MSLTVKDAMNMAQNQLERSGVPGAKTDAELIFRHMMGVDKMGFFKLWGATLDDDLSERFLDLISVRASGTPLQYITGEQEFMGLTFRVNPEVLIPRQDTEILAAEAVSLINESKKSHLSVLDLGCGCGAIGISIAKLCVNSRVTLSDISGSAIETSKQNAKFLNLEKKVTFASGDLFEPFGGRIRQEKFDLIVSNPPYIRSNAISFLQTEIKDHEPLSALDGGSDGLVFYRRIVPRAPIHLKKDGALALEIGYDQAIAVAGIAESCGKFKDFKIIKDLAGNDRVMIFTMR